MADVTAKPVIFISYSHRDTNWLEYVQSHLGPAEKHGNLATWDDRKIGGGNAWKREIEKQLNDCDVCLLLVSRYSLVSDFILDVEIETMLKRRDREGARIFPIVLMPCYMDEVKWLTDMNLRPRDGKALSTFPRPKRDAMMVAIVKEISTIVNGIVKKEQSEKRKRRLGAPQRDSQRESHLSDNLVGFDQKQKKTAENRILLRPPAKLVDLNHFPETAYHRLVGRDVELKRLDLAWESGGTNILTLVGAGGSGKTALVNEWLARLRKRHYRHAQGVLAWSFYSQGTRERTASADSFFQWALGKLSIDQNTLNAPGKAEALAREIATKRILLVLDGLEPLQQGPGPGLGYIRDQGLRTFLRSFVTTRPTANHGLVVITSRTAVRDIGRWIGGSAPVIDLGRLSEEDGALLLEESGVKGSKKSLRAVAHDFHGHALALTLLSAFLTKLHGGDVRYASRVRTLLFDPTIGAYDHARRVMEAYETDFLAGEPILLAIMYCVGLFDRPATEDCLKALRNGPIINGLTNAIVDVDDAHWKRAVTRLRSVRLLDPEDPHAHGALDAHPLVREWFGERLKQTNEAAWRAAHGRLFEHLRDTTNEGETPTLEDLAPLYQAVVHGCQAGRHQEALEAIFISRIWRQQEDGTVEFYTSNTLGAISSDLSAISWFFDKPYEVPAAALTAIDRSWVLAEAARLLRAQGRFAEALPAMRASLRMQKAIKNWRNISIQAYNLTEAELLVGEIVGAISTSEESVAYADRGESKFDIIASSTGHAAALHAAGRRVEAENIFADVERRQQQWHPAYPILYSVAGYYYCDLLLAKAEWVNVRDRASKTVVISRENRWLLDVGIDTLTLCRASLGLAHQGIATQVLGAARDGTQAAHVKIEEAIGSLRAAGIQDFIVHGLLVRSILSRGISDWIGVARDLDEVEEIAEPGPMRLYLCDMAMERARLAFARIEAFAPLNGLLEKDNPPRPEVPSAEQIAELKGEAEKQLKIAAEYIEKCGYHRRDEELAELQAVLRGEKKFADLPPRV